MHGCARVGVYLYICHDLNRDNLPFSSQKIDNTYYPLIENWLLALRFPLLSPLASPRSFYSSSFHLSRDPSSNNPASFADVIRYSVSLLYPQHLLPPIAGPASCSTVKVDGVSSIPTRVPFSTFTFRGMKYVIVGIKETELSPVTNRLLHDLGKIHNCTIIKREDCHHQNDDFCIVFRNFIIYDYSYKIQIDFYLVWRVTPFQGSFLFKFNLSTNRVSATLVTRIQSYDIIYIRDRGRHALIAREQCGYSKTLEKGP